MEKRYRLYIDESGDHTFKLAESDNHRYLGLLGIWFDVEDSYRSFAQALTCLKADLFGWHPDELDAARPKINCQVYTGRVAGYGKVWLD